MKLMAFIARSMPIKEKSDEIIKPPRYTHSKGWWSKCARILRDSRRMQEIGEIMFHLHFVLKIINIFSLFQLPLSLLYDLTAKVWFISVNDVLNNLYVHCAISLVEV